MSTLIPTKSIAKRIADLVEIFRPSLVTRAPAVSAGRADDHSAPAFHRQQGQMLTPPSTISQHVTYRIGAWHGKSFVDTAVGLGLCSVPSIESLSYATTESIAELAIEKGVLTQVQVEEANAARTLPIYVDANYRASPAFVTWTEDLKKRGFMVNVESVSAKQLIVERDRLGSDLAGAQDQDLDQIEKARNLFMAGAKIKANDIAILVRERDTEVQVRFRGDYMTSESWSMTRDAGEQLIRAICVGLATVKQSAYNEMEFQEAQITASRELPGSGLSSIRLQRGPMYPEDARCSFLIARLQYNPDTVVSIPDGIRPLNLITPAKPAGQFRIDGFTPLQDALMEEVIYKPNGIALVTGPTGSGKTTSMYESMKEQARVFPSSRQVTIENPPEYPQPWAITLRTNAGDFQQKVGISLRMDPDIILLGEIRYAEEAVAALFAAMTGHFVWSTLHVTDPYRALARLEALDHIRLSRQIICDHELIVALMGQRVVPKLCPECKKPLHKHRDAVPGYLINRIASWGDINAAHVRGPGCSVCDNQGIIGRQAVAEIVLTDEEFMRDYLDTDMLTARRNHRRKAGTDKSMLGNAMDAVFAGLISPMDVHRDVAAIVAHEEGL